MHIHAHITHALTQIHSHTCTCTHHTLTHIVHTHTHSLDCVLNRCHCWSQYDTKLLGGGYCNCHLSHDWFLWFHQLQICIYVPSVLQELVHATEREVAATQANNTTHQMEIQHDHLPLNYGQLIAVYKLIPPPHTQKSQVHARYLPTAGSLHG